MRTPDGCLVGMNCEQACARDSVRDVLDCDSGYSTPGGGSQSNTDPPETCGNGQLDSGETCDDGAESAECNVNCTRASCGDGVVNGAAGEACDDGRESSTCDADCSAAEWGDQTVNARAGEQCDDGAESIGCNDNCRMPLCGDGVVNEAAGEQCDDGNWDDGDGCSVSCLFENDWACEGEPPTCAWQCTGSLQLPPGLHHVVVAAGCSFDVSAWAGGGGFLDSSGSGGDPSGGVGSTCSRGSSGVTRLSALPSAKSPHHIELSTSSGGPSGPGLAWGRSDREWTA